MGLSFLFTVIETSNQNDVLVSWLVGRFADLFFEKMKQFGQFLKSQVCNKQGGRKHSKEIGRKNYYQNSVPYEQVYFLKHDLPPGL